MEIGGKPGKRFKERMGVTLLEWQKRRLFNCMLQWLLQLSADPSAFNTRAVE